MKFSYLNLAPPDLAPEGSRKEFFAVNQKAQDLWFKVVAVQRVIINGLDIPGVARELAVDDKTLSAWVGRYATRKCDGPSGALKLKKPASEILALCQELKDLTREIMTTKQIIRCETGSTRKKSAPLEMKIDEKYCKSFKPPENTDSR